jgi:hypothetical protein
MELEQILAEVAAGRLAVPEAAARIRQLFARPRPGGPVGPRPMAGPSPVVALICAGIGVVCLLAAVGFAVAALNFAAGAVHAEGTVVRLVATDNKGSKAPLVRYEVEGTTYEFQSSISSTTPGYAVGQKVPVMYRPENPGAGQIDSFFERWLMPIVLGVFGLVFTLVGCGMLFARVRRAPPPRPPAVSA